MRLYIKGKTNWVKMGVKDGKKVIVEKKAYGYARGQSYDIEDKALAEEMLDREIAVVWKSGKHRVPKAIVLAENAKKKAAKTKAKTQ